jgi:hypothetical protein
MNNSQLENPLARFSRKSLPSYDMENTADFSSIL